MVNGSSLPCPKLAISKNARTGHSCLKGQVPAICPPSVLPAAMEDHLGGPTVVGIYNSELIKSPVEVVIMG